MSSYWKDRKHKQNGEGHVDDWLMTYADMITLLLCFFAVFIAITVPDEVKFEVAKQEVAKQFASGNSEFLKGIHNLSPTKTDGQPTADLPFKALPSIIDRYEQEENIKIEKGDRITIIEMNSAAFFPKGSASLSEEGLKILTDLEPSLISREFKDYRISIEGYTDDIPIKTAQFPSNWELSTARASAVVRAFIDMGIKPERLRAVGFAETFPKAPNKDSSGNDIPENQAQNRRVVIRLEKIIKQK